jgi:predicted permease
MSDLKLALRSLFKTPFVTFVAILSLALGIGANAAIYSMFDQMLVRPLPVREPERLVNLSAPGPKPGSQSCSQAGGCDVVLSYPMFKDLAAQPGALEGIAAHRNFGTNLSFNGLTQNADGLLVSGSYFSLLGLSPTLGRLIGPGDDQTIGEHYVAVLAHDYWANQLGADSSVVNQTVILNGQPFTVIGVGPDGFTGTTLGAKPLVFVPLTMRGVVNAGFTGFDRRTSYWVYAFGRLKDGATIEQASTELNRVYHGIVNDVEAALQPELTAETMAEFRAKSLLLEDGRRGQSSVHEEAKTPLLMLFGVTGIVLLIACANIANLLLARGAGRGGEIAIRSALGAKRRQIIGQLLTEAVLLAGVGGLASLAVAWATIRFVMFLLPAEIADTMAFHMQPSVFFFTAAMSMATGIAFGIYPAMHSTRPDLITSLRANSGQPSGARAAARFRASLVTGQIALSMTLLMLAGLFIKSLANVSKLDLGLDAENVVTFAVSPESSGYEAAESRALFESIETELAAVPGVRTVSAALVPLLGGSSWGTDVCVEGFQRDAGVDANARYNEIGPDYLKTTGMQLVAGREFTALDDKAGAMVAIINETFAKHFGLDPATAVGKRMTMDTDDCDPMDVEIVGIVKDAKYNEVKDEITPIFFTPYRQDDQLGSINFYAKTDVPPGQVMQAIRGIMTRLDPDLPVEDLKMLEDQARESVFLDRMISTLSSAFALLATLLAGVGLYGVLAYTVAQRTREIGLRMALGAGSQRVRGMVIRQVGVMAVIGGAIGIGVAIYVGKLAKSLLFEIQSQDPLVLTLVTALLALIALGAAYVPAMRASRVDPMVALRYE